MNNATQGEYYGNVWKIGADSNIPAVAATTNNAGVNWDKADTTSAVPTGAEVITYSGLTIVPDDTEVLKKQNITSPSQAQMTDVYQWGYADVRVNGTAYGTAINPYASAASAESGGDGFDLSWAVDANGVPVKMSSARYIRVYSTVLFNAGIFGETSAEVCGLYRTSNTIADGAGMTAMPSVSVTDEATEVLDLTDVTVAERTDDNVICYNYGVDAGLTFTVTATDTDTLVFINGEARTSFTATSNAPIQVLVQKGTAEPFIVVIQ